MKSNQFTKPHHFTIFTLLISLAAVLPAGAQSVVIQSQPVRVTVSDSATNYLILGVATNSPSTLTNFVDLTNVTAVVDWSISGLPAGVGYTTFNYNQTAHDNTNDYGLNLVLNTTNLAQGEYIINLNATGGAENHFLLTLQSGRMWNGTTNVSTAWSSSSSWVGGIPPGASDDVLFTQLGAQPNTNNFFTNSLVTANTEIASLRFSQDNGNARYHTIQIDPGVTLRVSGTKGLKFLKNTTTSGAQMDVGFVGNEGRLVVSNRSANIVDAIDFQTAHRIDMSTLGTFEADVNRIGFGDYTLYPNYTNLVANGFTIGDPPGTFHRPRRFTPIISFARTNVIRANYVDPFNYTNNVDRKYAFSWSRSELEGTTANNPVMHLGFSNLFLCDSIEIGGFGATGANINSILTGLDFNSGLVRVTNVVPNVSTNFTTNTSFFACFRNTNGTSRVSLFAIGDSGGNGTNYAGSNVKVTANFANVIGGTVNALVDRLIIGRDKTNGGSYNTQAGLIMGAGIFDVNTAILGYQQYADQTNVAYARGDLTVTNTAVLKINDYIELGYTTESVTNTRAEPQNNRGTISIGPLGTVMANKILVGGITKAGTANAINLSSGANLIVSNKLGAADGSVTTFSVSGIPPSTLTLHLNGTNTGHYVYATNMTIAANQVLTIASTTNLTIPPTGTNVPLFFFENGSGLNFSTVNMPLPMRGTVVPGATANETDLLILTNAPKNLVWRGTVNNNWNLTNKNWLDTSTGLLTNYFTGDAVTFDDLGGVPTTVNVQVSLVPDTIVVSNSGNSFILSSGGGSIIGGSLVKNGSGSLAIDVSTSIPVQINQGTLTGLGSIASVVVASGATMDFSGAIGPSGVSCAGTATLRGTTTGGLTVQSGGILTNAASGATSDSLEAQDGSLLYNAGTMGDLGSSTVRSNAVFINAGNLGTAGINSTLTVSGIFKDTGAGGLIYLTTLDISGGTGTNNNNAGTFVPGGDGIGVTIIRSPGVAGTTFSGRVRFGTGSTNIFKVDAGVPTNTVLRAPWIDFGPSVGVPTFNGGFVSVTNVGGPAFAAGQLYPMFAYVDGTPPIQYASTNSYPIMSPTNPAPGLAWDLSNLKPGGVVAIKSYPTTSTNITFLAFLSSRTNNAGVTNATIVTDMQWPSNYIAWSAIGWHIEEQSTTRSNGLRIDPTNWSRLLETYFTNRVLITNNVTSNSVSFWRMAYP